MFSSIVILSCIVKTKTFTVTVFLRYARFDKNYRHIHFLLLCEYMTYIFILWCFILYNKLISCYIYFRFAIYSRMFLPIGCRIIWDKTWLSLAYVFLLRIMHSASCIQSYIFIPSFLSTFKMTALYVDLAFLWFQETYQDNISFFYVIHRKLKNSR